MRALENLHEAFSRNFGAALSGFLRTIIECKVANIERVRPDVIAAGNIGCMTQIASGTGIPIVHTAELLDWATGGPKPAALAGVG